MATSIRQLHWKRAPNACVEDPPNWSGGVITMELNFRKSTEISRFWEMIQLIEFGTKTRGLYSVSEYRMSMVAVSTEL